MSSNNEKKIVGINVPEGWKIVKIRDIAKVKYGKAIPKAEGEIPAIGSSGVYKFVNKALIDKPTIVIGRKGTAGEIYLTDQPSWPSDTTFYLDFKDDNSVILKFLYYHMVFFKLSGECAKTTLPSLKREEVENYLLRLPPLPEQKKIAEILSTVDKAIQKVDEAIAKTERLKKGLMQELLTKGIGHTEFKYSKELGCEIPKEWKVVSLGDIVNDILTGATPLRSNKEYWLNGNIPWLTNEEVEDGKINYIWDTKEKVTEKALKETNIKLIPENSVILSLTASIGKVAINKIPITTNQQFNSFIIDSNKTHPEFLGYYFIFAKRRIELLAGTTTFKFISKSRIANFKIPLPPLEEQRKIAEILSTVDKKLELERKRKEKLERIKKGLMNDLLTGRRRVKNVK